MYLYIFRSVFDELTAAGGGRRSAIAAQPFYHASGLAILAHFEFVTFAGLWILCYALLTGHHSLVMRNFVPQLYLQLIERHKVEEGAFLYFFFVILFSSQIDTLSLGPWLIRLLLQQNLSAYNLVNVPRIWQQHSTISKKNAVHRSHNHQRWQFGGNGCATKSGILTAFSGSE